MKTYLIPKVITLLAGAVVCIVCIVRDMDTLYSLKALLVTLIIFYIIGCIAKRIIGRVKDINTFMKRAEPDFRDNQEGITAEDISISSEGFENNNM